MVKKVEQLRFPSGEEPFSIWFDKLDARAQARVALYIDRVAAGGSKARQSRDIKAAKIYWREYVQK